MPKHTGTRHARPETALPYPVQPNRAIPKHVRPHPAKPSRTMPRHSLPDPTEPCRASPNTASPKPAMPKLKGKNYPCHGLPCRTRACPTAPNPGAPEPAPPQNKGTNESLPRQALPDQTTPNRATPDNAMTQHAKPNLTISRQAGPKLTKPSQCLSCRETQSATFSTNCIRDAGVHHGLSTSRILFILAPVGIQCRHQLRARAGTGMPADSVLLRSHSAASILLAHIAYLATQTGPHHASARRAKTCHAMAGLVELRRSVSDRERRDRKSSVRRPKITDAN